MMYGALDGTPFTLYWTLILRNSTERAARKVMTWSQEALGEEIGSVRYQRWWKDPDYYEVTATQLLGATDVRDAVFETLLVVRRIGTLYRGWDVSGPEEVEPGRWRFELSETNPEASTRGGIYHRSVTATNIPPTPRRSGRMTP